MPAARLTWDNIYEGECRRGHPYTEQSTKILVRPSGTLKRVCRTCLKVLRRVRRQPGEDTTRIQAPASPPHVLEHWKTVAGGGREALVKEVTVLLDDMAGPYAVGVMSDNVFWAKFREAFADGFNL